jgi:glutathione synthase/RimK-type ligase-like ATP-grasp enzyme
LAERFTAQGVPVVNAPAALANCAKSHTLATARRMGVRAGRTAPVTDVHDLSWAAGELGFPLIVRPDWGHGSRGIRIDSYGDIRALGARLPVRIGKPLAIQFIDTAGDDGLFRKCRYLAAGDRGVSVHLIISAYWEVRGDTKVVNDAAMAEERAFITAPNPHADTFDRLRRALGLDLVAFDYGHDRDGNLVVWEANPYPQIAFGADSEALRYRSMAVHRCFAAMACLYLARARLEIPPALAVLVDDAGPAAARYESLVCCPPVKRWLKGLSVGGHVRPM